jgi:hypothetical protein
MEYDRSKTSENVRNKAAVYGKKTLVLIRVRKRARAKERRRVRKRAESGGKKKSGGNCALRSVSPLFFLCPGLD